MVRSQRDALRGRWGCLGLVLGCLAGLLGAIILFIMARQGTPARLPQTAALTPPDITIFLSEQSLSRFASESFEQPVLVETEPEGRLEITTRVNMRGWMPLVRAGLSLGLENGAVVSRLDWVQFGFLRLAATWLPERIIQAGGQAGPTITGRIPPEFELVGLTTAPDGIHIQLKWLGQP